MKTISGSETKPARTDPLRAYRFTSIIRHVISALYGVMLGYAIMAGNAVINYFVGVLSAIFSYIFVKTLAGKYLVKVNLTATEPDVVRGSNAIIVAKIRNYTPFAFPVSYIFIKDSNCPDGQRIFFFLRPFANLSMAFPLTFEHCGEYLLKPDSVRLISAGGMVWTKVRLSKKKAGSLSVTPDLRSALVNQNAGEGSGEAATSVKPALNPTDSVYVRQYLPGDDPRYIHWKRSASREDWLLRSFYQEGERNYFVYFNARIDGGLSRDMKKHPEVFEKKEPLESSLALADKLSSAALSVCAALFSDGVPFYFVYPARQPKSGEETPDPEAIFCESNTAFSKIRHVTGTTAFLPGDDPYSESTGKLASAAADVNGIDERMLSFLNSLMPSADSGITVIQICTGRNDVDSVSPDGPDGVYGGGWTGDEPENTYEYKKILSAASSRGGSSGNSHVLLNPAEFFVRDLPEAEYYATQLPGAYIITVEVRP